MDTLDKTDWDVIISGTGLPQSLLALALSRSGKKILHVDRNDYYGGSEAALSLSEAETWAEKHAGTSNNASTSFTNATVTKATADDESGPGKLSHSRAYSLALAPQLLYTRSSLLPILVSSRTHDQLDFQAVGSWFIVKPEAEAGASRPTLTRVPGGREDIFQDDTLDLKAKRSLMKFLRFITKYEEQPETWQNDRSKPLSAFLQDRFSLPEASHGPLVALALSTLPLQDTSVDVAIPRISRYLSSIGLFGPGFGALIPKWGGLAEIAQVACRACAVGGGVYVLGKGVSEIQRRGESGVTVRLSDDEEVTTKWLVGESEELPDTAIGESVLQSQSSTASKSISIISSPLASLFPPTSEGGVTPAGAVLRIEPRTASEAPVHIFAHSSDSGECAVGQCVLYASTAQGHETGFDSLQSAVSSLLSSIGEGPVPRVLWKMQYQQQFSSPRPPSPSQIPIFPLASLDSELALEDYVLDGVKTAWQRICSEDPEEFMKFEAREGTLEDD